MVSTLFRRTALVALSVILSPLGASAQTASTDGTIVLAVLDYRDGRSGIEGAIRFDDGRIVPLDVSGFSASDVPAMSNRRVRVQTSDLSDGMVSVLEARRSMVSGPAAAAFGVAESPQAPRFLVIPCQTAGGASLVNGTYVNAISGTFPGADLHVRQSSRDASNYANSVVTPNVSVAQAGSYYYNGNTSSVGTGFTSGFARDVAMTNDCLDALAAAGQPQNLADYDGVVVQHNLSLNVSYAYLGPVTIARAGVNHVKRLVMNSIWAGAGVYAHEIGHTYGFQHTQSRAGLAYTSRWSVMANAYTGGSDPQRYGTFFSGVERTVARWNSARVRTLALNSDATVHLTYPGSAPIANDADVLLVTVPNGSRTDTIVAEARRPVPGTFDSGIPADAVVMHRISSGIPTVVDIDATDDPNDAGAQWLTGESYELPDIGLRITIGNKTASGYEVSASYRPRLRLLGDTVRRVHEGFAVRDSFTVFGAQAAVTATSSATLPGMTFDAGNRRFTGTPTGNATTLVTVTDGTTRDSLPYRIERVPAPWRGTTERRYSVSSALVPDTLAVFDGPTQGNQALTSVSWSALPSGWQVTVPSSGGRLFVVLNARPTTVATTTVNMNFTVAGVPVPRAFTLIVGSPFTVTTGGVRRGAFEREAYADTMRVDGTADAVTWSIASGSLPAGLTINASTGIISGSPTDVGTFSATVRAQTASGSATASISITVASSLTITAETTRPRPAINQPYTDSLTATARGVPSWRVVTGALPPGVTLAASGKVSGTPTATGTYTATIEAALSTGAARTKLFSWRVNGLPLIITTTGDRRSALEGEAYADTLRSTGGDGSAPAWGIASGALPRGLTLDGATGIVSGTPLDTGTFSLSVRVTRDDETVNAVVRYAVQSTMTITSAASRPRGAETVAFRDSLTATSRTPAQWRVVSGTLPTGLTLATNGLVSGTPTARGTYRPVFEAAAGVVTRRLSAVYVIDAEPLRITSDTLVVAAQGYAVNRPITTAGGTGAALTWRVRAGTLPSGISFVNGVFSGATELSGDTRIEVEARDDAYTASAFVRLRFTPSLQVALGDSVRRQAQMGVAYADTLKATTVNDVRAIWTITDLPRGLTLSESGVLAGTADTSGTFRMVARVGAAFPAKTVTYDVPIVITVQAPAVGIENVIDHLLSGGTALSPIAIRFLDQTGNGNGRVDVGDVLKWLQRQGLLSPRASSADAMDYLLRLQKKNP